MNAPDKAQEIKGVITGVFVMLTAFWGWLGRNLRQVFLICGEHFRNMRRILPIPPIRILSCKNQNFY